MEQQSAQIVQECFAQPGTDHQQLHVVLFSFCCCLSVTFSFSESCAHYKNNAVEKKSLKKPSFSSCSILRNVTYLIVKELLLQKGLLRFLRK
jgi:hypothetical protein